MLRGWERLILALLLAVAIIRPAAAQNARGWVSLFDGQSMDGWTKMNGGNWSVRDGALSYTGGGNGWLRSNREYSNFSLVVSWRFPSGDRWDSGLFLRAGMEGNPWPSQGYQVQMLKGSEGEIDGTQNAKKHPELVNPVGQWNVFQVTVVGDTAALAINGHPATVGTGLTRPSGYLGWQAEGFPLEVRQIAIAELPAARASAAPALLAQLLSPPLPAWADEAAGRLWSLFVRS
jgi:hypothetical protein